MSTILDQFYKLKALKNSYDGLEPRTIIGKEILKIYIDGFYPELSKSEISHIENSFDQLVNRYPHDIFLALAKEIDFNVATIPGLGSDQVTRYLRFVEEEVLLHIRLLKERFEYDKLLQPIEGEEEAFLDTEFFDEDEEWEIGTHAIMRYNGKDPIGHYLYMCRDILDRYNRLQEHLNKCLMEVNPHQNKNKGFLTSVQNSVPTDKTINTFESMFYLQYQPYVDQFVDVLRELDLITTGYKWKEGKDKGASRIFFDVLKDFDVILPDKTHTPCAVIFDEKFGGLLHMFKKAPGEGAVQYQPAIEDRVRKLIEKLRKN